MVQLHKKFGDSQVKELIERYLKKEIERQYIQEILGIKKRRFFALVKKYRENPGKFSVQYTRKSTSRKISPEIEKNILKELSAAKKFIQDKDMPIKFYNYSYIKDLLIKDYNQEVSLPTIIDRAKRNDFYIKRHKRTNPHTREVLTNYAGELIQHDTSHHKWSPYASEKWYLITSLDDFSRYILYAVLLKKETSWAHIRALESVFLKHGFPLSYYVDSHSIFRFVQGRDSIWRKHYKLTDEADPQWKQVMKDCGVEVIHALSPQAKGKIERPYGWLQDRLVRTCAREGISEIEDAQGVLNQELERYNHRQVHSTTLEVPYHRFQGAIREGKSLFREFKIKPPFKSTKDIFCLRSKRTINPYRKISISNLQLKIKGNPRDIVNIRIYPLNGSICELRFWCNDKLIDIKKVKSSDLNLVHF